MCLSFSRLQGDVGSVALAVRLLCVLDTREKAVVFKAGWRYELIAVNQAEGTGACPLFVGDRLDVRGQQHLYCLGTKAEKQEK